MVREVKRVLREGPCTLSQVAAEMGMQKELVRAALHFWIIRGDVLVEPGLYDDSAAQEYAGITDTSGASPSPGCGHCGAPNVALGSAVYRWKG